MELITDELFDEIVADNVKKKSTEFEKRVLDLPENLQRWQDSLVRLLAKVDQQLVDLVRSAEEDAARYSKLGSDAASLIAKSGEMYEDKRKKLVRFRYHVDAKLDEVTRKVAGPATENYMYPLLKRAVEKHRELKAYADVIDHALWAALDGEWGYGDYE